MPADTAPTTDCPPTPNWRRLLRGRLTEARTAACGARRGVPGVPEAARQARRLRGRSRRTACAKPTGTAAEGLRVLARAGVRRGGAARTTLFPANGEADETPHPEGDLKLDFLQPTDEPGRLGKLGTFGVLRIVGRGGMGVVLHAYDPCLDRDVAIKVIDPQAGQQRGRPPAVLPRGPRRRRRHPRQPRRRPPGRRGRGVRACRTSSCNSSSGESLEQRLKRVGKLTPAEVARLGMQAAAGLAAAHAGGLIHRDIKPGNILLESAGRSRQAHRLRPGPRRRGREADPHRLRRRHARSTWPRSRPAATRSITAPTCSASAACSTRPPPAPPPFDGKTPLAVLRRVADETPPPLHAVNPDVPEWLSEIVDKLLAKNPADRYQSAAEVAEVFAAELAQVARALAAGRAGRGLRRGSGRGSAAPAPASTSAGRRVGVPRAAVARRRGRRRAARRPRGCSGRRHARAEKIVEVRRRAALARRRRPARRRRSCSTGKSGAVWAIAFLGWRRPRDRAGGRRRQDLEPEDRRGPEDARTAQNGNVWSADVSSDGKYLVTPATIPCHRVEPGDVRPVGARRSRSRPRPRRRCSARTA